MTDVNTIFTKTAEALLQGEDGLAKFEYQTYPNIGDTITVRTSPNNKVLTFVSTARHFDFSKKDAQELAIVLDSQPLNSPSYQQ